MKDNQNPKADIGFIVQTPYHFYVFKNVIKYLPGAEFVVESEFEIGEPEDIRNKRIEAIDNLFNQNDVFWRLVDFKNIPDEEKISFLKKYKVLVSTNANAIIKSPLAAGIKKIRLQYGLSKDLDEYGAWNRCFNLILAHGPHSSEYLKIYADCKEVGFPKFDDWFNNELDRAFIRSIKNRLEPSKKTVLYMPTHGALSSLRNYFDCFVGLKEKYNLIVKFHSMTIWRDPESVELHKNSGFLVYGDNVNIMPLLRAADIVVTDTSGAIFDALLTEKPLVIIDVPLSGVRRELDRIGIFRGLTTYEGSIEQIMKKDQYRIGPVVNLPIQMENAIEVAEKEFMKFRSRRLEWRKKLFSYVDGKDGRRAADEILKFKNSELPPRKFFSLTLDEAFLPLEEKNRYLNKELTFYRNFKKMPFSKKIKFILKNLL